MLVRVAALFCYFNLRLYLWECVSDSKWAKPCLNDVMPCCAPPPPPLLYNTNRCCAWLCPFRHLLIHHVFPTYHWPYEYDNEGGGTSPGVIRTSLYCVNGVEITYLIVYSFQSLSLPPFFFCIYFEKQVAEWYRVRELSIKNFNMTIVGTRLL